MSVNLCGLSTAIKLSKTRRMRQGAYQFDILQLISLRRSRIEVCPYMWHVTPIIRLRTRPGWVDARIEDESICPSAIDHSRQVVDLRCIWWVPVEVNHRIGALGIDSPCSEDKEGKIRDTRESHVEDRDGECEGGY